MIEAWKKITMDTKVGPGIDSSGPFKWAIVWLLGFLKKNNN